MASVYGNMSVMDDQRAYLTIPEISKRTGRSETTVRRWIEKVKRLNPEAILKEDHKNYFTYKVETGIVDQHFNVTPSAKQQNNSKITANETPEGYILVHEKTFQQIQDQIETAKNNAIQLHEELAEKNRQMKQLLETNTKVSGFIADMGRQALLPDSPETSQGLTESDSSHVNGASATMPPVKQESTGETAVVKQHKTMKKQQRNSKARATKTAKKPLKNRKELENNRKKGFFERLFS